MQAFFSYLLSIRGKIIYIWLAFLAFGFIYNYISLYINVAVYHAVMSPVFLMNTIWWTPAMIYALILIWIFPDTLKIIKRVISKL